MCAKRVATRRKEPKLADVIRLLPGYDPYLLAGDCRFDEARAQFAIDFCQECCRHVKGPLGGELVRLELWQKAIFANLWGWVRADGYRRFREALIFLPRGNSKTTLAAMLVCLSLFTDLEPGAELYSSAADRDQARLCFQVVTGMIRAEPALDKRATIYQYSVVVEDRSYKALSSASGTKHGLNVQLLVNDELHAHPTPELTETLMTGMGKRLQPMAIHLTTSDYEREGSICNRKHEYASRARDNPGDPAQPGYDPAFLPVIYEASKEDDWLDPKTWAKANPNLGISVPLDYIQRECQRAREDPAYENEFKRLHLNIRTEALSRWITTEVWDACQAAIKIDDFAGRECFAGLDLASSQDFNALAIAFRDADPDRVAVFLHFWVPEETAIKREREKGIPYSVWARQGLLTLTPGGVSDPARIHADIKALFDRLKIKPREVAVDRWMLGLDLIRRLTVDDGLTAFAHGQGSLGMIPPTKCTKDLILAKRLQHDGNPILRWMISNTTVHPGEGREYPMREKCPDKIDGVVAMVMAVGRAMLAGPDTTRSYYEDHPLETF